MEDKKFITLLDLLREEKDSFSEKPFDKMDTFVLSVASYLQWENSLMFKEDPSFELDTTLFPQVTRKAGVYLGPALNGIPRGQEADIFWFNEVADDFMDALGQCPRYEAVRVSDAVCEVDPSNLNQFAAVTFRIPDGSLFVSFRGTDSTVTGWEEDFLLAIMSPIPSQIMAKDYLDMVVESALGSSSSANQLVVRVGGHSKGGNLAFYCAKHCAYETERVLVDAYSFDGPGFPFTEVEAYKRQQKEKAFVQGVGLATASGPYYHKYVPSESVFGKLFYDLVPPQVVESSALGLMQHQPFTWRIHERDFVFDQDTTVLSRFSEQVFDGWVDSLSFEEKAQFLGICFGAVDYLAELAQSDHIEDLPAALPKALPVLASSLKTMDDETRQCITDVLSCLAGEIFSQATSSMHPLWSKSASC
ncbi:MAG: Mbeg1-like protein [Anaerotardibacter sp.]